ncbi:MAG: efflux RND transporter periplasmic adaptor subunit [Halioglobus sp.]
MKYLLWGLAAAALVAVGLWKWDMDTVPAGREKGSPDAVPVSAYTATLRSFQDQTSALGTLKAWESVDISASVAQIVTSINFEDGQHVTRGAVLATLKQGAEQASLREQQAALVDARREVQRLENLARQNQVAQNELDKSRTTATIIQYRIEEIEARLRDHTITAPFSGVLGLRLVSEGALVSPGQRLTTLDDLSRMRLDFSVPATRLGSLALGQSISATSPAFSRSFTGEVAAIDSRIDPISRALVVRATLQNPDMVLRPGLLMEVVVRSEPRQALLVPEESLQSRSSQHFLWLIENDTARRIEVEIGGRQPGWVEIRAGLDSGSVIVRDGVHMLRGDKPAVNVVGS